MDGGVVWLPLEFLFAGLYGAPLEIIVYRVLASVVNFACNGGMIMQAALARSLRCNVLVYNNGIKYVTHETLPFGGGTVRRCDASHRVV